MVEKKKQNKYWSARVTNTSNALDLESGVFTFDDPRRIASSLRRSALESTRHKGTSFQSAISMLNFYINRAGKNLSSERKRILNQAKHELRKLFGKAIAILVFFVVSSMAEAKQADLAGQWYSSSGVLLRNELEKYLEDASVEENSGHIIGLVAPHAGYRFSGPIAGYTYKALKEAEPSVVIVVGFTHRQFYRNRVSVFRETSFTTPLGEARIDLDLSEKFLKFGKNLQNIPEAFDSENSIEMQIPFIQAVLPNAKLVLLALCDQSLENCNFLVNALYEILQDRKDFVIIASSDMSHYLTYDEANRKDAGTIKKIEAFDPHTLYTYSQSEGNDIMCGLGAVYTVMETAKRLGADEAKVLKYANSGDTFGDKDRVVGYLSAAFVESQKSEIRSQKTEVRSQKTEDRRQRTEDRDKGENMLNQKQREELLKIARSSIESYLKTGKIPEVKTEDNFLKKDMGAFVTLHKYGELRGCIGHIIATGPLYLTIRDMAIAAATEDPRFSPMKLAELDDVDIEISVLSPLEKIDDYKKIEMGKHGVMVKKLWQSGVYLPQVATETLWTREEFMTSLCAHKAGLSPDAWKTGQCEIYIFTAEVFNEEEK